MRPNVISVDIPDPDNFMMVLAALQSNHEEQIDIVLSGRPISFDYAPYDGKFAILQKDIEKALDVTSSVAIRKMLQPVKEDGHHLWTRRLSLGSQPWFIADATYTSDRVRAHSNLYAEISKSRLIEYLDAHGIARNSYNLFTCLSSMSKIEPGMRHAAHKRDWSYCFNASELEELAAIDAELGGPVSALKGDHIYNLVERVQARVTSELANKSMVVQGSLEDLVQKNLRMDVSPHWIVGGPLTEFNKYRKLAPVSGVTAMGGFIDGNSNIFANQFNFHVDMASALEVLDSGIPTVLIPSEFCKGSPLQLNHSQLKDILGGSPPTIKLINQYYGIDVLATEEDSDASLAIGVPIFDLITYLAFNNPELFDSARSVEHYTEIDFEGTEIIRFRQGGDGHVSMFWSCGGMETREAFHDVIREIFKERIVVT